jgi:pseudouridine-5'-phosphate glycosidase
MDPSGVHDCLHIGLSVTSASHGIEHYTGTKVSKTNIGWVTANGDGDATMKTTTTTTVEQNESNMFALVRP